MKISWEWLGQYVDLTGLTPQTVANALTNAGLEVEGVHSLGAVFQQVVVAQILQVEPHPQADRLRLVTVRLDENHTTRVVCGAPNVREGIWVAFAKEGATVLNRKDGSPFVLGVATIRGVESRGMICAIEELGLAERYQQQEDGIWVLDSLLTEPAAALGQDLKQVLALSSDVILETAPTANRGDQMSVIGVAREVAALFERPLHRPELSTNLQEFVAPTAEGFSVSLADANVCQYYAGALLNHVRVAPSPAWMVQRLEAAGIRSINNVVDITNYVMLEFGQPLHAFDRNRFGNGGTIGVRFATEAETLTTLDGQSRTLTNDSVVITLNDSPVALAGVMGGESTEILPETQHVFLEAAYFPPASTRRSARSVGLRTDSSARFERGVDFGSVRHALARAMDLLVLLAQAQPMAVVEHQAGEIPASAPVRLSQHRLNRQVGLDIPPDTVREILTRLGFETRVVSGQADSVVWEVAVPSFRQHDVRREIDLIEEVIRVYGYDRIPYTLPEKAAAPPLSLRAQLMTHLHRSMQGLGLQEVVTTSLLGEPLLAEVAMPQPSDSTIRLTNSHSSDHALMRQRILPTLLTVAQHNQFQGLERVWVYELGRTYQLRGKANHKNTAVSEKLQLAGLMMGPLSTGIWRDNQPADYYHLKGVLDALLHSLGLQGEVSYEPKPETMPFLHPGQSAQISLEGKRLGYAGRLHPQVQERLKLRQPVLLFELDVDSLQKALQAKQSTPVHQRSAAMLSSFPSVDRDLAFCVSDTVSHQQIQQQLRQLNQPLIQHLELFDEYRSDQLPPGTRSLAYRFTLQSSQRTLTDADADQVMAQVRQSLEQTLQVQFR
ncbi:MAG: phenylalanine--tRNA ligase subunit beta [Candidatus Melainabacteria bacterium]|nr:phenylalanine--tRNA ligase subunit beta [Candidatus Melainabacteria bacterium]